VGKGDGALNNTSCLW